jgi:hypothetical protein
MENLKLEEWKVATNEAMHFNDLLMKNRQMGFTVILAILWGSTMVPANSKFITIVIAAVFAISIAILDLAYYFRLLLGAVERAEELEKELGFGLTQKISQKVTKLSAWIYLYLFYGIIALSIIMFFGSVFIYPVSK